MLHAVNKKRLAQAIESYNRYVDARDCHGYGSPEADKWWERFYRQAQYCCNYGDNTSIPQLIYNCHPDRLTVDNVYYAILILGLNEDGWDNGVTRGEEYYEGI